jgi:hypothetical protein
MVTPRKCACILVTTSNERSRRRSASGGDPFCACCFLTLARVEPPHPHVPCETEGPKRGNAVPVEIYFVPG